MPNPSVPKRLLASIHDVGPRSERETEILADLFANAFGAPRFAMLVVPDHWGEAPLAQSPAFQRKLRAWSDQGIEMFVHGWYHRDMADHKGLTSLKARAMTAGEGEFLGLTQAEASKRMDEGKALIEDIIGRATTGFIAPAWLYGAGAHAALKASPFPLVEDHFKVWQPQSGAVLARGPVITWASRSRARIASSLAFAAVARTALQILPVVRIGVHPGDVGVPSLVESIKRTVSAFTRSHSPGRYADLGMTHDINATLTPSAKLASGPSDGRL